MYVFKSSLREKKKTWPHLPIFQPKHLSIYIHHSSDKFEFISVVLFLPLTMLFFSFLVPHPPHTHTFDYVFFNPISLNYKFGEYIPQSNSVSCSFKLSIMRYYILPSLKSISIFTILSNNAKIFELQTCLICVILSLSISGFFLWFSFYPTIYYYCCYSYLFVKLMINN